MPYADPAARRANYAKNKERERAAARVNYQRHRESRDSQNREWALANPERAREIKRAWRERNAEAKRLSDQRYREANRDKAKAFYDEHAEEIKAYQSAYRKANPEKVAEWSARHRGRKLAATVVPITQGQLDAKLAYWGGKCWMCSGVPTTWDHVKPLAKGGAHILANLRPACHSCNCSKKATWPYKVAA